MVAIAAHGESVEAAAGAEVAREAFDDAAGYLFAVLTAAVEDEVRAVDRNVGRMGDDAVEGEFTGGLVKIALRGGDVRDAVEAAVELGEDRGTFGDVVGIRMRRAIARGQQSGDSGSGAEIQKGITGAGRDRSRNNCVLGIIAG